MKLEEMSFYPERQSQGSWRQFCKNLINPCFSM